MSHPAQVCGRNGFVSKALRARGSIDAAASSAIRHRTICRDLRKTLGGPSVHAGFAGTLRDLRYMPICRSADEVHADLQGPSLCPTLTALQREHFRYAQPARRCNESTFAICSESTFAMPNPHGAVARALSLCPTLTALQREHFRDAQPSRRCSASTFAMPNPRGAAARALSLCPTLTEHYKLQRKKHDSHRILQIPKEKQRFSQNTTDS